ncbi:MAG: amidohydrolase family protein [bacterium]|nr:amidohydrolase family protein [bacterium]MCP5067198.1 amidohydrolase family protein [bacterium]
MRGRIQIGIATAILAFVPLTANAGTGRVDVHMHLLHMDLGKAMGVSGGQTPRAMGRRPGTATGRTELGSRRNRGDGRPNRMSTSDITQKLGEAADALVEEMDATGVETALVVTVPFERLGEAETLAALQAATRRHPERLRHMAGGARLKTLLADTDPSSVTETDRKTFRARAHEILDAGAVGFGEMISYHLCMTERHNFQHVPADHPLFLELADVAAERNAAIDLHMEAVTSSAPMPDGLRLRCSKNPETLAPTIPALETLLAHNRRARIVWQHIGWDNTGQMTPALLGSLLDKHANLFLALRVPPVPPEGVPANRIVDANHRINPDWLDFIERYQDRLVVGSDEFIGPGGGNELAPSFDTTWKMVESLPDPLVEKIGGKNARRIYNLE